MNRRKKKKSDTDKYRETVTAIVTAAEVWYLEILRLLTFFKQRQNQLMTEFYV